MLEFFQKELLDLVVLDQQIDTPQPMGKLMFHVLASFAKFECSIRKERQAEGIEKAIRKGGSLGRPLKLTPAVIGQIKTQRAQSMIIKALKSFPQLGKTTLYRALAASR